MHGEVQDPWAHLNPALECLVEGRTREACRGLGRRGDALHVGGGVVYGGAAPARVQDEVADATVGLGRRLLQRVFGFAGATLSVPTWLTALHSVGRFRDLSQLSLTERIGVDGDMLDEHQTQTRERRDVGLISAHNVKPSARHDVLNKLLVLNHYCRQQEIERSIHAAKSHHKSKSPSHSSAGSPALDDGFLFPRPDTLF